MLNNNDQELLIFLTGCLCISVSIDGPGLVIGAGIIYFLYSRDKKKEEEEEK